MGYRALNPEPAEKVPQSPENKQPEVGQSEAAGLDAQQPSAQGESLQWSEDINAQNPQLRVSKRRRRVQTQAVPGSDPSPGAHPNLGAEDEGESEQSLGDLTTSDDRIRREKPPHYS